MKKNTINSSLVLFVVTLAAIGFGGTAVGFQIEDRPEKPDEGSSLAPDTDSNSKVGGLNVPGLNRFGAAGRALAADTYPPAQANVDSLNRDLVGAQSPDGETRSTTLTGNVGAAVSMLNLLEQTLPNAQESSSKAGEQATQSPAADLQVGPLVNKFTIDEAGRVESIHRRIDLLKRVMTEKKRRALEKLNPPSFSDLAEQHAAQESATLAPNSEPPTEAEAGQIPEVVEQTRAPNESPAGMQVTPVPVDSWELANSLFRTGNYAAARKSYEARLENERDEQEIAWLKCLIGNCLRLEGDLSGAEAKLREVTNEFKQSYPVDFARWGIEFVQQRRKLTDEFELLSEEIDALVGENK